MKKFICLIMTLCCVGCVTVKIPRYIEDRLSYKKKFYASFDATLAATQKALADSGWRVSETTYPSVFEHVPVSGDKPAKQMLLFTEVRQTPVILTSRYMNLNVYVKEADSSTDVEVRYVSVTPMIFRNIQSYKNDVVANHVLDGISKILEKK